MMNSIKFSFESIAVSVVVAIMLLCILYVGWQVDSQLLTINGAITILVLLVFIRTSVQRSLTSRQTHLIKEMFPEEYHKNRTTLFVCQSVSLSIFVVLLARGFKMIIQGRTPVFATLTEAAVVIGMWIYLWVNNERIYTINQLRMMKGTLSESIDTIELKISRRLQQGAAEGKAVSIDKLQSSLRAEYQGSSQELYEELERIVQALREQYGPSIPIDEAYKIAKRMEKGLPPFQDSENRSEPLSEDRSNSGSDNITTSDERNHIHKSMQDQIASFIRNKERVELYEMFAIRQFCREKANSIPEEGGQSSDKEAWLELFTHYDRAFARSFATATPADKELFVERADPTELVSYTLSHRLILDWRDAGVARTTVVIFTIVGLAAGVLLGFSLVLILVVGMLGFVFAVALLYNTFHNSYVTSLMAHLLHYLRGL
jgi:hypothetical protein